MTTPKANQDTAISEHAVVIPTGIVAIRTRFYGPGNVRGARVTAWRADESSARGDVDADGHRCAVTLSWDHGMSAAENHAAAVAAYVDGRAERGNTSWCGRWVLGAGDDGYFAVKVAHDSTCEHL